MQIEIIRNFASFIITHNNVKFVCSSKNENLSISKGAFLIADDIWAVFFELRILNWAFLSEHYFSSEYFNLSMILKLSILAWVKKKHLSIFFKDLSTNNHYDSPLFFYTWNNIFIEIFFISQIISLQEYLKHPPPHFFKIISLLEYSWWNSRSNFIPLIIIEFCINIPASF